MNSQQDIVLAFSGGLDTSFCVPYLQERGYRVHTVFADTGGVDAETFSGAIYIQPASWVKDQSLSAKTFSGDIEVHLPSAAAGSLEFNSFSGDIKTDVPLLLQSKSKRSLHAQLNEGGLGGELYFKTFSGDVRLLK